jgi:hypothetical protein
MEVSRITQSGDTDLERSFFYPKPRVLVTWNPNSVDQLRMRVEREVGQLDFGDFIASADLTAGSQDGADANLEPQRSWVGEVAWERRFWGAGSISATLTHSEISDVVDYKPLPGGGDAPSNIGDGRSDQFVIALTLPTQKLGISGGQVKARLSWFDSEVTDPVTFEKRRITNATPFVCNVSFTRDMPGGKWSWGASTNCANENSRFRFNEVRTSRFEQYFEGFVEWKPRPDLTVRTTLSNWTSRNVTRERTIYKGSRADNNVDRAAVRALSSTARCRSIPTCSSRSASGWVRATRLLVDDLDDPLGRRAARQALAGGVGDRQVAALQAGAGLVALGQQDAGHAGQQVAVAVAGHALRRPRR